MAAQQAWMIATLVLAPMLLLALLAIWSMRRHRSAGLQLRSEQTIDELLPSLAGLSAGLPIDGNALELLENGRFFDVLVEAIGNARRSVHLETFLWKDGVLGRRVAAALAERARSGCEVRLVLDAIGCKDVGDDVLCGLREAGCGVALFRPKRLRHIGVINERTHRKIVVIDGREAFVGGHCITDHWLGEAEDASHYADLSVRVRGPVVATIQSVFSENWVAATGEVFVGDAFYPQLQREGDLTIHTVYAKPAGSAPAVKLLHHSLICLARQRLWIQNPYFIPEPEAIEAFAAAVRRGVDVRVLMPATSGSDMPMVQHAGHRNFARLLRCGVRLFEYPSTLLHQKVVTVDGRWSAVGSCNFDDRSFETNDEIVLGVLDEGLASRLDGIFEYNAARSQELELEQWQRRGTWHKLKDHAFYTINEFL